MPHWLTAMLRCLVAAWAWIGANQAPLTVLVTTVGVGAAIVYAVLTRRLWRETQRLAAETQALGTTTAAQTQLTRDMFQAEQRPYVALRFDSVRLFHAHDVRTALEYRVFLRNHGKSPAIVHGVRVDVKHRGALLGTLDQGAAALYLFPGEEQLVNRPLVLGDVDAAEQRGKQDDPVVVEARVDYSGTPGMFTVTHNTAVCFDVTRTGIFLTHQVTT